MIQNNPFHRFTEQQCAFMREALIVKHMVIIDAMWGSSNPVTVSTYVAELNALVQAYRELWQDTSAQASVFDKAHVLSEEARLNVAEKLKSLEDTLDDSV